MPPDIRLVEHDGNCDHDDGRCGQPATRVRVVAAAPELWDAHYGPNASIAFYCPDHGDDEPAARLEDARRARGLVAEMRDRLEAEELGEDAWWAARMLRLRKALDLWYHTRLAVLAARDPINAPAENLPQYEEHYGIALRDLQAVLEDMEDTDDA